MSTVVASAAMARRQRRLGRGALAGRAAMWAVLLGALILSVAPGVYMLSLSFMDNPQLFAGRLVPWPPHTENYPRAWVASNIGRLYWNSIYVSTLSMIATVAISALAGYGLGRIRFAGRGLVYGIVLIGLTIPLQIALIPLFMNLRALGLLNTPFALIGPYTGFGLAFGTFIMKGFFEGLPRELEEAARLDGAGEFGIFARVMLPLTRPALATVAIFLFLQNWNEFLFAIVLTGIETKTMMVLVTSFTSGGTDMFYGEASASVVLGVLPAFVIAFMLQRYLVKGLALGGTKG